jgi:hypothetical protein
MDDELLLPGMTERERNIRRRVHRVAEFYRHVFVYVIVISAIWCINLWSVWSGNVPRKWYRYWAIWPTLGWGIGLLSHGLSVLPMWGFFSQDWEDKKVKELLARDDERAAK